MNAATTDLKVKAWTPATLCKSPDNIVSSQFTSKKVFVPSYEKETRPCMEQLLTNEYQRIWWEEKASWDKRFSSKITTKKLLQRMVIRRKPPTTAVVEKPKKVKKPKKKIEGTTEKPKKKIEGTTEKPKEDKEVEETTKRETTEVKPNNKCDEAASAASKAL